MPSVRQVAGSGGADAPILRETAWMFRSREPQPDTLLFGFVHRLQLDEADAGGTILLSTAIDDKNLSVGVALKRSDYEKAVQSHRDKAAVTLKGDLERSGQRWRLLNPRITGVIREDV